MREIPSWLTVLIRLLSSQFRWLRFSSSYGTI